MPRVEPRAIEEGTLRDETVKHYLETIFYIGSEEGRVRPTRVAEWLGVQPSTVSVALRRLKHGGWIRIGTDRTVTLTKRGTQLATTVVRVHRLLERWLTDSLGFDWAIADQHAQEIAPAIADEVADRLDEYLGHPATCPHGNVIPGRIAPYGALVALAELPTGVSAHVRRISEVAEHDAPDLLRRLNGNGLVTGVEVSVSDAASSDAIVVQVGGRSIALGAVTAGLIWVEPSD